MSEGIPAIFDNGVFRPVGQVDLPDQTAVTVFLSAAAKHPGDGIRASAGAWADAEDDFDQWLVELRRWRDMERGTIRLPDDPSDEPGQVDP